MSARTVLCLRRGAIAVLICALAFTGWELAHGRRSSASPTAESLDARLQTYVDLRLAGNWLALYGMVAPQQRETVPELKFLAAYGTGVLTLHSLTVKSREIDAAAGTAMATMSLDAEMKAERLPEPYRSSLQIDDPAQLRKSHEVVIAWVWTDGEWYFELDPELLTGRDRRGRKINLPQ